MNPEIPEGKILIRFDGMCILCSRAVKFILKADKKKLFLFQSLQDTSEEKWFETIIVTDQWSSYQYFDAIFKIGNELGGIYKLVLLFRILPQKWRNQMYLWIAKNRFIWFGVRKSCYRPTPDEMDRFI